MKVKNKVALVTGGARRMGKDTCMALAELGFDIILTYNDSRKSVLEETIWEIGGQGVNVTPIKCDVTDVTQIKKLFSAVNTKYKRLDLLINNAAIFKRVDFFETTEKMFDKFIATNLKSVFFCSQEGAKIMSSSNEEICRIINIASLGAFENWTGYIPYSISKAAVVKLTQQLAKRLAPRIIVNSISPGTIIIENDPNENVNPEEEKKYPMKRFGRSEDINSLIRYLALENKYITGQNFIVDGGRIL